MNISSTPSNVSKHGTQNNIIHYEWEDKNGPQPRFSVRKNFLTYQFQTIRREDAQRHFLYRTRMRLISIFSFSSLYNAFPVPWNVTRSLLNQINNKIDIKQYFCYICATFLAYTIITHCSSNQFTSLSLFNTKSHWYHIKRQTYK